MKKLAFILALLSITAFGCKREFWTFVPAAEDETVTVADTPQPKEEPKVEPAPEEPQPKVEPETPKQVILILGIDGMD